MAPAHLVSASAGKDSIKGLAQAIARPAYRRLLVAESALRRAVPILIIAFLGTMAVGAGVQVHDHRRQVLTSTVNEIDLLAEHLADRIDRIVRDDKSDMTRIVQDILQSDAAARLIGLNRDVFVTTQDGVILAGTRPGRAVGFNLIDILGPDQPLTTFGASAGVLETPIADGTIVLATVRGLKPPLGQIAIIQPETNVLAFWRSDTALTITLSATTGFVVLILGFAFHWQATRAREADAIYDAVRARVDTALNRGRCGLWDWDLARGRIFW